ncbi:MAG: ABC transporter ATP-binding protein [Anaerolineales bacterium]|nr:ABC transporter ATP-binding protein [Anaerolineales bacterium]
MLATEGLIIGYGGRALTPPLDVELRAGELVCLIGPNGAGKSTLLRTLAGMQRPLAGHVRLGGDDVYRLPAVELAKRLAIVLTERVDAGNLSAYALAALGRYPYTDWRGTLTAHDEAVVRAALTQVGAAPLAARPVNELSDGERQRVMIARALAQEPQVLLLDEPTAFLDLPRRVDVLHLLATLARERRCAVLLTTHDLDLALRVADRLWLLTAGGAFVAGLPEELALNGALGGAFRSEGVEFDSAAGAFKMKRHPCGPVALFGEGLAAQWTARALERIGYEVHWADPDLPLRVEVSALGEGAVWRLNGAHSPREYRSLAELIEQVQVP